MSSNAVYMIGDVNIHNLEEQKIYGKSKNQ